MVYPVRSLRGPPPLPSRQNKASMQKRYREKEVACFNTLRDIIKGITGEELRRRQEILAKAIDLLSAVSEIRKQRAAEVPVVPPLPFTNPADTGTTGTQAHWDHSAQLSQYPKTQMNNAELDAQSAHYAPHWQFHGQQQYDFIFDVDFALVHGQSPGI